MAQAKEKITAEAHEDPAPARRPEKTFKSGGIEVSVWRNRTEKGDQYNTTIRNAYKDDATGEWKDTASFSATDLAVVSQLTSQAFAEITALKTQSRIR